MTIFFELKLSDNYENPGKLFKDEKNDGYGRQDELR